ncbi:MAG: ATP-binding cassette domain-containing protein [Chloroflexi bacterium]|nr:ATP-binding cassette domain-containing protein [Chloroflexota bacterium]
MPAVAAQLTFAYPRLPCDPGERVVLRDVHLSIEPGAWVAILGATGSGKTTLCWALAGLAPAMTGGRLDGQLHVADGQSIGFVFQDADAQLFNMTAADEIAFGLETAAMPRAAMQARVEEWLAWARLDGLGERAPWQLSGGQKKRLALASVLALAPSIVVLDDPTAGLDPAGAQEVVESLNTLRRAEQHSVIIATADAELAARYADRLLVMDAGRIVVEGTPSEVFRERDTLDALGIGLPQIAELAHALRARGCDASFLTCDEAAQALHGARPHNAPAPRPAPAQTAPLITFDDVQFRYPDAGDALRGISFSIGRGEFVALLGANGSGKSTLAKHVNGLLRPTAGRVLLDGADIAHTPTGQLARRVGYVFQNPDHQIFAATVREEIAFGLHNIGMSATQAHERTQAALETFDLRALAETPPAVLNYGARRLVTLAATWAMQPEIWVLDEPTTGLDAKHADLVMQHARTAWQAGATIILISHDMARVAAYAGRVIVLSEGRIVADGPTRDVLADAATLAPARLLPPPVLALAQRLGWTAAPLTVAEFAEMLG